MIRRTTFELTTEEANKIQEAADIVSEIKDIAGESKNGLISDQYDDIASYDSLVEIIHVLNKLVDNTEYTVE